MKYLISLFALLISATVQSQEEAVLYDLASLKWKNRIILVNEPSSPTQTVALLEREVAAIQERDVFWFVITGSDVQTNYPGSLAANFREGVVQDYTLAGPKTLLIGKDGGLKQQLDLIDLNSLFASIDSMPMRQQEMRD